MRHTNSIKLKKEYYKNITSWDSYIDNKYEKKGTTSRIELDESFETFKIGVLIQEARKKITFNSKRTC